MFSSLVLLAALAMPSFAHAAPPRVRFDTDATAVATDVTTDEQLKTNPQTRVLAVELRVSMLLEAGSEDDLKEVLITVDSPEQRARVVDFFPRTEMSSDAAGPIARQETTELQHTLDVSGNLLPSLRVGPAEVQTSPGVGNHWTEKKTALETYQRLAPKKLLRASGTLHAGHGVFFKLHPSNQESLQGTHMFRLQLAVPAEWRYDRLVVTCQARGVSKVLFVKQEETAGQGRMTVGLYLSGDAAAQRAANRLANAYLIDLHARQNGEARGAKR
ncbi:MAG: hypothetical protein JSS27_00740 [Planctomycetes bacterium]|nr:hypothetical protein [Planctomycetota bacterium]